MRDDDFERLLADAVLDLNDQPDPPHTLQRLIEMAPEFFPSCDFVGISLVQRDRITTPVASNEHLRVLDERQYVLGEGPCRDAIRRDNVVMVDDLATDARWPIWGKAMVSELGIRSSLSFRLFTRADSSWGALNIYSRTSYAFTEADVVHGQTIAAMASASRAAVATSSQPSSSSMSSSSMATTISSSTMRMRRPARA